MICWYPLLDAPAPFLPPKYPDPHHACASTWLYPAPYPPSGNRSNPYLCTISVHHPHDTHALPMSFPSHTDALHPYHPPSAHTVYPHHRHPHDASYHPCTRHPRLLTSLATRSASTSCIPSLSLHTQHLSQALHTHITHHHLAQHSTHMYCTITPHPAPT